MCIRDSGGLVEGFAVGGGKEDAVALLLDLHLADLILLGHGDEGVVVHVEGKAETDFFGNLQTPFRLVKNKVIVPDEAEIERNPRSRSAKLRIAEKK